MEQFEAVGMNQQINSEIEFVVIKMAQFIVNVILSFKDLKTFDQVMWREFQVLNSPKDKSVQSPTLCLMSNVMIMRNVIAVKIHILNAKYFHHQTQLMPLVLSELMELVDAYLLQNVRNSDDAQMLLLLQMMNASLMDQNVLWMEPNAFQNKLVQAKIKENFSLRKQQKCCKNLFTKFLYQLLKIYLKFINILIPVMIYYLNFYQKCQAY